MAITHALVADGAPLVGAADWNANHVVTAADVPIVDTANNFTATEVEGALAELQADAEAHLAASDPHPAYQLESGLPLAAWPVGSVFIAVVSTNPNTLLGGGTWAAIATGRMLIGIDAGDPDFDVVEETGGAKTHTLTSAEMPSHTHVQNAHLHQTLRERSATTGGATTQIARTADTSSTVDAGVNTENATATNQNTGGGGAHNNMPPYLTVYMWKRTA